MGPSGSGKTTLLNCIATIIQLTSGQILLNGEDISQFNSKNLADIVEAVSVIYFKILNC